MSNKRAPYLSDGRIAALRLVQLLAPKKVAAYRVRDLYEAHLKEKDEILMEAIRFMRHIYGCPADRRLTDADYRLSPEQLAESLTCTCGLHTLFSHIKHLTTDQWKIEQT